MAPLHNHHNKPDLTTIPQKDNGGNVSPLYFAFDSCKFRLSKLGIPEINEYWLTVLIFLGGLSIGIILMKVQLITMSELYGMVIFQFLFLIIYYLVSRYEGEW